MDNLLFKVNLTSMKWESFSDATISPPPRKYFGFSWCDGGLYVFGGNGDQENGKCCHGNHIVIHAGRNLLNLLSLGLHVQFFDGVKTFKQSLTWFLFAILRF